MREPPTRVLHFYVSSLLSYQSGSAGHHLQSEARPRPPSCPLCWEPTGDLTTPGSLGDPSAGSEDSVMVVIGHLELTNGGQGTSATLRFRGRDFTADPGLRREEQDAVPKGARQARAGA